MFDLDSTKYACPRCGFHAAHADVEFCAERSGVVGGCAGLLARSRRGEGEYLGPFPLYTVCNRDRCPACTGQWSDVYELCERHLATMQPRESFDLAPPAQSRVKGHWFA